MTMMQNLSEGMAWTARWTWDASLAALPLVLLLILLGAWRSLPARIRLFLGMLLVIRLLLPMVPSVTGHPMAWLKTGEVYRPVVAAELKPVTGWAAREGSQVVDVPTVAASSEGLLDFPWQTVIAWGWGLGALAMAGWAVGSHRVLARLIRRSARPAHPSLWQHLTWAMGRLPVGRPVELREVAGLPTVALWGWRRSCILVPEGLVAGFTTDEIRGMFLHELAHVRRRDVLWTWVGLLVAALHWYNPLVWVALRRLRADRELECDRLALGALTGEQRSSYGFALLKTLERPLRPAPAALVPFGQTEPDIKTRIRMIASPHSSHWLHRAAAATLPLVALVVFTTARADDERPSAEKKAGTSGASGIRREGDQEESAKVREPREGEGRKEGMRDGEERRTGPRDGEQKRTGPRDGETQRTGPRDGEQARTGPRDGEERRSGPRDGEAGRGEGEGTREGARAGRKADLTVAVAANGGLTANGRQVTEAQLQKMLEVQGANGRDQRVVVEASSSTAYRHVLQVLEMCKTAQVVNVAVSTAAD